MNTGTISQIIGVVVDVHFPETLPEIYHALEIPLEKDKKLVLEVQQHIGGHTVRTISMGPTDGLTRGA